ncbi:MAG: hemerythrin domain-containing protein [Bacillota bacterium]
MTMSHYPTPPVEHRDWSQAALAELADHIESAHHAYTREELARLMDLINAIIVHHGPHHPELFELRMVYRDFRDELVFHLLKEEQTLFPWIRQIEQPPTHQLAHHDIAGLVRLLKQEHDHGNQLLDTMERLIKAIPAPADTQDLLRSLGNLQADMQQHVHEEDDILFPKVLALYERVQNAS